MEVDILQLVQRLSLLGHCVRVSYLLVSFWLQGLWSTGRCDLVLGRAKLTQCQHTVEKHCLNTLCSSVTVLFLLRMNVNIHHFNVFHFGFMALINNCLTLLKKSFLQLLCTLYKTSQTWRTSLWGSSLRRAVKPGPTTCPERGGRPTLLDQVLQKRMCSDCTAQMTMSRPKRTLSSSLLNNFGPALGLQES